MNKITRMLRIIFKEFGWLKTWDVFVVPFLAKEKERVLMLYDEVYELMKEKKDVINK